MMGPLVSVTPSAAERFWRSPDGRARFTGLLGGGGLDAAALRDFNAALIGAQFCLDAEVDDRVRQAAATVSARRGAAEARSRQHLRLVCDPPPARPAVWLGSSDRSAEGHDATATPALAAPDDRFAVYMREMRRQRE